MKRFVVFWVTIGLLASGCNSDEQPTKNVSDPQAVEDGADSEGRTMPLTGLTADGDISHPVVMVMVNNHPKARPQTGLDRADIVFEVLAEGEITRFAAFYHSETEGTVGPVRSVRPYYLDLAEGLNAVVAHAGGSPAAKERYSQSGFPSLDGIAEDGKYFTREDFRQAPHNLYTSVEQLLQGASEQGFANRGPLPQLTFAATEEVSGSTAANDIDIVYGPLYAVRYTYDTAAGHYTRWTQGEMHVDLETEQPLTMHNVLAIKASHRVLDEQGRREVGLTGSGEGWLFQKGTVREIQWKYVDGFPRPYADGQELPLVPGKTWVNVVPEDADVRYGDEEE